MLYIVFIIRTPSRFRLASSFGSQSAFLLFVSIGLAIRNWREIDVVSGKRAAGPLKLSRVTVWGVIKRKDKKKRSSIKITAGPIKIRLADRSLAGRYDGRKRKKETTLPPLYRDGKKGM